MVLLGPRIHFFEINDQSWWPDYLREKVQSALTLLWTFRVPLLQKTSPAQLVAVTLRRVLSSTITDYTYVDFCAGAGGPTPYIEKELNQQLLADNQKPSGKSAEQLDDKDSAASADDRDENAVTFLLTDIHPHISEWTKAAANSKYLDFVSTPVDAANAPADLIQRHGRKTFRLFFLAFHHFDDDQAREILRDTLETADGFGIFELQERTLSSMITITAIGALMPLVTPFYYWRSPGHLFFTYIIPLIPLILVLDGYVSSLRTRTPQEIRSLMRDCGASADNWTVKHGVAQHTWPTGYLTYVIGVKDRTKVQ